MRAFVQRALAKAPRMNEEQLRALLSTLAEENSRLEAALDSMLDGIVVCDLDHIPLIYNKSAERMLGLQGADSGERPLWLSVTDHEISDFLKEALRGEETVLDREFGLELTGGRIRLVAISLSPLISSRGRISGTIIHLEDITEKRKRESQLRRAESLASLTTLAAGVAHEIKNPLGSISIHIQLIQRAIKQKRCPESENLAAIVDRHLGVVTEEIERLNKIVVDFLFAVRPMNVELRDTDPREILGEIHELLLYEAERAGVELRLEIEESLPRLLLDRRYMKQAILNLAKNALAAMPEGGTLTLSARRKDDEIQLSVEDTGIGIPEDEISKIFEPYYTTKESGTGLGLTITYKIVKEHRGDISVRSKPGQGSVFTISLPIPQKERRLLSGPSARSGTGSGADAGYDTDAEE